MAPTLPAPTTTTTTSTTTLPPDPTAGWIQEEVDVSVAGRIRDFAAGPIGTFVLTNTGAEGGSQIVRRVPEGDSVYWENVLEIPQALGQSPQTHLAVGESSAVALIGVERRAISVAHSDDGVVWEISPAVGFAPQTQLMDVISTPLGFMAAGRAGAYAATWISVDGVKWTETKRWPTKRPYFSGMAVGIDTVVLVGRFKKQSHAWSSTDGHTWNRHEIETPATVHNADVVRTDGSFVLTGQPSGGPRRGSPVVMDSLDGAVWESIEPEHQQWIRIETEASGGSRSMAVGRTYYPEQHPNYCVLNGCGSSTLRLLAVGETSWLESSVPFDAATWGYSARLIEADGEVLLAVNHGEGMQVWRAGPDLALLPMAVPVIPEIPWEWVDKDENPQLDVGVEYAIQLGGHCGIDFIWRPIDDRYWWVVDGWEFPPEIDHMSRSYTGTIELVEEDRLVFRLLGETIAEYEPVDRRLGCE